jgi:hypothetical protein
MSITEQMSTLFNKWVNPEKMTNQKTIILDKWCELNPEQDNARLLRMLENHSYIKNDVSK